jgi:hydrogenase maturation protease
MGVHVIGCGNPDRGDDAAGVLVARRLRQWGVAAQEQSGEALSLMDILAHADKVILVDAVATDDEPGTIQVWNANFVSLPKDSFCCSTHAFGVREAVELARTLGRLPQSLIVYGIAGRQFQIGAALSPAVSDAVERVAQQIIADFFSPGATQDVFAGTVKEFI